MSRCAILLFSNGENNGDHPFAAKASLLRFRRRALPDARLPPFLLQKASPLNASSVALFSLYLKNHTLSDHIASFCRAAELFCTHTAVRNGKAMAGSSDFKNPKVKKLKQNRANDNAFKNNSNGSLQISRNYAPGSKVKDEGFATSSEFAQYGNGFNSPSVAFTSYSFKFTFKNYARNDITFSNYKAMSVEAGKFFRENLLVQGKTLLMPEIKDFMPKRSFLPASLANNLPFSTQTLPELMKMFHIPENSSMAAIMARTLRQCERAAVKGEIKKCVRSVESMAEFVVSVLGSKVEVLTTESTAGSGHNVSVGAVMGKGGGKITRSVSCHQSLFPFLVYYCHSVPKVRVYQAALLSMKEEKKINEGVAICHLDTRQWSAKHAAFVALGHEPGEIEVCHWIFENDLVWVPLAA
ncbi:polygalacturonase 1 beta-like protein 2 isoform X2 [Cryptomeria japonica]|uniref:polygalacturonase 1 beta-like protein 2 isoform X2 n=1 Tax=Cryptomeria japonica TaxID=3369 RepID=UPI0025AB6506|nr:polygalacturonase 1 beta-like protein 2 isoform X2 [Cryptomeria japonica]